MASVTSLLVPMESNFLVPNATFFVELAAFLLLFCLLAKFVIPPINRAMTSRQDAIRQQFADLDQAKDEAHQAEAEFKAQIADARHEAARIREEAREQGAAIIAEMREQAQAEASRIVEHAHTQIEADRKAAVASLRAEVGTLATTLAGRIVGESLDDEARQSRVVDRFLEDLDAAAERRGQERGQLMQGSSGDSLAKLTEELGSVLDGGADGAAVGNSLFAAADALRGSAALRRAATDPSSPAEAKSALAEGVFGPAPRRGRHRPGREGGRAALGEERRPRSCARAAGRGRGGQGRRRSGRGRPPRGRAVPVRTDRQREPRPAGRPLRPRAVDRGQAGAGPDPPRGQGRRRCRPARGALGDRCPPHGAPCGGGVQPDRGRDPQPTRAPWSGRHARSPTPRWSASATSWPASTTARCTSTWWSTRP